MQENETPPSLEEAGPGGRDLSSRLRLLALGSVVCLGVLAVGRPAHALQGGEDASTLPVLIDKQNRASGKLQTSILFSTTLATKFTESTGATLNLQYNFVEQFGIELTGGFFASSEAQILREIRSQIGRDPLLSDMHQMQWLAAGNLVWTPIYGKISFASEWNPSFDLYLLAGGGVVGTTRDIAVGGANPNSSESAVAPSFNFGGGLRIYIVPWLAARVDVRNYYFDDPDRGEAAELMTTENPEQLISGMSSALVGQVGVQFNFGGSQ